MTMLVSNFSTVSLKRNGFSTKSIVQEHRHKPVFQSTYYIFIIAKEFTEQQVTKHLSAMKKNTINKRGLINQKISICSVQFLDIVPPATQVATDLDIAYQTLCKWIQKYKENQVEPFVGSGNLRSADQALRNMEKRLRDLEEENAI